MAAYEDLHGVCILDYVDVHYYPQGSGIFSEAPGVAETQSLRLRSTRALWDPTYAAERNRDGALTLMIVNKAGEGLTSTVPITGCVPAGLSRVYRYSDQQLDAIVREPDPAIAGGSFTTVFPANSITLVVAPPAAGEMHWAYLPLVSVER